MKAFKKFLIILTLIKNVIYGLLNKTSKYTLSFKYRYDGFKRWYYDWDKDHLFKWAFKDGNLEMVAGADDICEYFSNGRQYFKVDVIISKTKLNKKNYEEFVRKPLEGNFLNKIFYGAEYTNSKINDTIWICPVTLFVFGKYPKFLYIKNHES